jgi:hypothetical protein
MKTKITLLAAIVALSFALGGCGDKNKSSKANDSKSNSSSDLSTKFTNNPKAELLAKCQALTYAVYSISKEENKDAGQIANLKKLFEAFLGIDNSFSSESITSKEVRERAKSYNREWASKGTIIADMPVKMESCIAEFKPALDAYINQ